MELVAELPHVDSVLIGRLGSALLGFVYSCVSFLNGWLVEWRLQTNVVTCAGDEKAHDS